MSGYEKTGIKGIKGIKGSEYLKASFARQPDGQGRTAFKYSDPLILISVINP